MSTKRGSLDKEKEIDRAGNKNRDGDKEEGGKEKRKDWFDLRPPRVNWVRNSSFLNFSMK